MEVKSITTDKIPLDKIFYTKEYNPIRRAKLMLFKSILSEYKEFHIKKYDDKMIFIKELEESCYNYSSEEANKENIQSDWDNELFCDLYHITCYKISSNLEKNGIINNQKLFYRIINGEISINDLPKMTSQEMYKEKYIDIINKLEASKNVVQTLKTTSMHKCKRCKENQCTVENLYNRSIDEGTNLKITCMNCGNSWNG